MSKNDKQILKQYTGGTVHDADWYDVVDELEELDKLNEKYPIRDKAKE
ncbi:hypothetical protein H6F38_23165 [Paenibacillus sp. EKM208P]|nr:hypothetical protein H6F38_23165 [Paenibacillus sp. EKM208P]